MKFDCIIGNPPYQDNNSQKPKLWPKFIKMALNHNPDYILFITPSSWCFGTSLQMNELRVRLAVHLSWIDLNGTQAFNNVVAEDICSWFWNIHHNDLSIVIDKNGQNFKHNFSHVYIQSQHSIFLSIQNKVFNSIYNKLPLSSYKIAKKDLLTKGNFLIQYSASQELYSNIEPIDYYHPKVFINRSGHYWTHKNSNKYIKYMTEGVAGSLAYYVKVIDKNEGENLIQILKSKLFVVLMQYNPTKNIQFKDDICRLPLLDLKRQWFDDDLYKLFKLNNNEIEYIENIYKDKK
jgi:hypothetical protein